MAANRYAEMVRWMAWPRIKNSRSSAQPGTHPHNGVQATVNPAPDAEPPPGSGQNTGVHGTTHAVAYDSGGTEAGPANPAGDRPRVGRLSRPIRYAHSGDGAAADPARPSGTVGGEPPAVPPVPPSSVPPPWEAPPAEPFAGPVLSGTVLPGPAPADEDPPDYEGTGYEGTGYESTGYESTGGLIYEAPRPAYAEPLGPDPADDVIEPEPVHNEGLGIFGGVATTEVPDDADTPTRDHERAARPAEPGGPPPAAEPEPTRVIPIGAAWNQPIAHQPVASEDEPTEGKPNPFGLVLGLIRGSGHLADDEQPRVSVRDLPPDVQVRFIRIRVTICLVVGLLFGILTRSWEIGLTLAILAWIIDTVRRSRSAALYANGARFPGARKDTIKQLRKMRREGYFSLDARPIPNSREYIDHLVVGPTGVYAIDSEKWNPRLPIRTWNGKKLYHGPESQKDRLEHAVWEATQASEILSAALGTEIVVRPALAIYGPKIPWDITTIRNVDVFTGPALRKYLKRRGRMKEDVTPLTREEVRTIYDTAQRVLPDVSESTMTTTPVG
jgi:hypothetical protein